MELVWKELRAAEPELPAPTQAGSNAPGDPDPAEGPDSTTFQLVWDLKKHHLEVDLLSNGEIEWFYRDRSTGEIEGGDGISERLRGFLELIAAAANA